MACCWRLSSSSAVGATPATVAALPCEGAISWGSDSGCGVAAAERELNGARRCLVVVGPLA